jgi:hypothetical protein
MLLSASQKKLQDTLRFELKGAIFEFKELPDVIPISLEIIDGIKIRLPIWPCTGRESAYYESMLKTFNTARDVLKERRSSRKNKASMMATIYFSTQIAKMFALHAVTVKPDLVLVRCARLGTGREIEMAGRRWCDRSKEGLAGSHRIIGNVCSRTFLLEHDAIVCSCDRC